MKKAAVLISGGLDSTTLLHHVIKSLGYDEVYALSFDYGQKHSRELIVAKAQCDSLPQVKEHNVLDISYMGDFLGSSSALVKGGVEVPDLKDIAEDDLDQPVTYVPNRNMMLLSIAASFAESRDCRQLYYGAQAQDEYGYWDCTESFLARMNDVFSLNRRTGVHVEAPFVNMSKGHVAKIGLALGIDYAQTWTCYRGGDKPCEVCPSCVERALAFKECGIDDPLLKK